MEGKWTEDCVVVQVYVTHTLMNTHPYILCVTHPHTLQHPHPCIFFKNENDLNEVILFCNLLAHFTHGKHLPKLLSIHLYYFQWLKYCSHTAIPYPSNPSRLVQR